MTLPATTKFVALDVETANPSFSSICQIGVVAFDDCAVVDVWQTLVNPQDIFSPANTAIHGIAAAHVEGAPTFPAAYAELCRRLRGMVVAHHSSFDRVALGQAVKKHSLSLVDCTWLDTSGVVRRTWPEVASRGYGLADMARTHQIEFRHHHAAEDARVSGELLLRAIRHSGVSLADWPSRLDTALPRAEGARKWTPRETFAREGNPDGPLAGEIVVFTGELTVGRGEAAERAAKAGCDVADGVTKKTTLLVVGDQDARMLAGKDKSSKHLKAEALIEKGVSIRILAESDFFKLVGES